MCTVSFIPLKDKIILTSNRDEDIQRPALEPALFDFGTHQLIYPKDPKENGSWIAIANDGRFVCLLNGAFSKHEHQPPYRHSRGKVVIDFFDFDTVAAFHQNYPLENIEPFTLIILDVQNLLHEFRWDGQQKHLKSLDPTKAHIYSSSTLYNKEIVHKRENWFKKFLKENEVHELNILNFHKFAGEGDQRNDLVMTYKGTHHTVKTTSVTQIVKTSEGMHLAYHDLLNDQIKELAFE